MPEASIYGNWQLCPAVFASISALAWWSQWCVFPWPVPIMAFTTVTLDSITSFPRYSRTDLLLIRTVAGKWIGECGMWSSMGYGVWNYAQLCWTTTPYVCPAELRVHIRGPHGAFGSANSELCLVDLPSWSVFQCGLLFDGPFLILWSGWITQGCIEANGE